MSLERWAAAEPTRAHALIDRLLANSERRTHGSGPDYRRAIAHLLAGCGAGTLPSLAVVATQLTRTLRGDLFEGEDEVAENARWSVASQVVPALVAGREPVPESVVERLRSWAGSDARTVEEDSTDLDPGRPLLHGFGGGVVLPHGSYPHLRALAQVRLRGGQGGWSTLLDEFEALIDRADAKSWRALLGLPPGMRPGSDNQGRWLAFLESLFNRRTEVLAHPESAYVLWSQVWIAPPEQMRRWLTTVRSSGWASANRFAAELGTVLACVPPHVEWASAALEQRLDHLGEDESSLGVAHGLAVLWSDETARSRADGWVERFVGGAPRDLVSRMLRSLRSSAFQPRNALFRVIDLLEERGIDWPRDHTPWLAESLLDAIDVIDLPRLATAAEWLVSQAADAAAGTEEPLMLIALHLTRQPADADADLRRHGMDLFDAILSRGSWQARHALQTIDEATRGRG